jgi:WD40 repeat protein
MLRLSLTIFVFLALSRWTGSNVFALEPQEIKDGNNVSGVGLQTSYQAVAETTRLLDWSLEDDLTAAVFSVAGDHLLTASCGVGFGAEVRPPTSPEEAKSPLFHYSGRPPKLILWESATGKKLRVFDVDNAPAYSLAISNDGKRVASGGAETYVSDHVLHYYVNKVHMYTGRELTTHQVGGLIKVWDVEFGKRLCSLVIPGRRKIGPIAFNANGSLIEASVVGCGPLAWKVDSSEIVLSDLIWRKNSAMIGEKLMPWQCVDANHLVLQVDDLLEGRPDRVKPTPKFGQERTESYLRAISMSPDGSIYATGYADGSVRFWRTSGQRIAAFDPCRDVDHPLRPDANPITMIGFNSDGTRLAFGNSVGYIQIWDPGKGRRISAFQGPKGHVIAAAFLADSVRIITGGNRPNGLEVTKSGQLIREPLILWDVNLKGLSTKR